MYVPETKYKIYYEIKKIINPENSYYYYSVIQKPLSFCFHSKKLT